MASEALEREISIRCLFRECENQGPSALVFLI